MHAIRNFTIAAIGALAIAMAATAVPTAAQARGGHWGGGGHYWGGGWGPGFVGGLVVGSALAAPYYYGGPYAYAYGPDCYIRRRVFINRYGHRIVRHIRVCE